MAVAQDYEFSGPRMGVGEKNILCVRAWGDCKAIRHAPFVVAFHCCSCSGIVQMDSGGVRARRMKQEEIGWKRRGEEKKHRAQHRILL